MRRVALGLGERPPHVDGVHLPGDDLGALGQATGEDHRLPHPEGEEDRVLAQAHRVGDAQVVEQLLHREVAGKEIDRLQPGGSQVGDRGGERAGRDGEALDLHHDVVGGVGAVVAGRLAEDGKRRQAPPQPEPVAHQGHHGRQSNRPAKPSGAIC